AFGLSHYAPLESIRKIDCLSIINQSNELISGYASKPASTADLPRHRPERQHRGGGVERSLIPVGGERRAEGAGASAGCAPLRPRRQAPVDEREWACAAAHGVRGAGRRAKSRSRVPLEHPS